MAALAATGVPFAVVAWADTGYEQVTLRQVRRYARQRDGAVFYAHTKGATSGRVGWRREMLAEMVPGWRENMAALETYDTVGPFWRSPDVWPGLPRHFSGNYWMARCDYLRRLPDPEEDRLDAEQWIGLANPRALSFKLGVPSR